MDCVPTTIEALTPGLLVFFDRPSRLQTWAALNGYQWRHVGITAQTKDGLKIVGYSHGAKYHYLPIELLAKYRRIGVARVFSTDDELETFNSWCRSSELRDADDYEYTATIPVLCVLNKLSRELRPGLLKKALCSFVHSFCRFEERRFPHAPAFVCSTWVLAAIQAARSTPLRVPMESHPDDLAAYAMPATTRDLRIARWFAMPDDLWRSIGPWDRGELELTEAGVGPTAYTALGADEAFTPAASAATGGAVACESAPVLDLRQAEPSRWRGLAAMAGLLRVAIK